MKIAENIDDARIIIKKARMKGKKIGFVPTMGALHEGHMSLCRKAVDMTDYAIASVFVNPSQFGASEDLSRYPRDFDKDRAMLKKNGIDLVFYPTENEIYPDGFGTWVQPGEEASILEGERRPGHFRGVCTVVLKLFQIVQPDVAFFGQKDAQQFVVLNRMVKDFNIPVKMVECPIIRDDDGLALSSRNSYLNRIERTAAPVFYRGLKAAEGLFKEGVRNSRELVEIIRDTVVGEKNARLDYVEVVDTAIFTKVDNINDQAYIVIAGYIGDTRLIDNIKLNS